MSTHILPLPAVADRLAAWAQAAATAQARANDPDAQARYAGLVAQYEQMAASVRHALMPVPAPRYSRATAVRSTISTERFWQAHGAAQRAVQAVYGDRWAVVAPLGETFLATLPARLRSYKTERGVTIRYRADWRMPAARFWPGGQVPVNIEITPDYPRASQEVASACMTWQHERMLFKQARRDWRSADRLARTRNFMVSRVGPLRDLAILALTRLRAARQRLRDLGTTPWDAEHTSAAWQQARGYVLREGKWTQRLLAQLADAVEEHRRIEANRRADRERIALGDAIGFASR